MGKSLHLQLTAEGQLIGAVLLRLAAGCSMHLGNPLEKILAGPQSVFNNGKPPLSIVIKASTVVHLCGDLSASQLLAAQGHFQVHAVCLLLGTLE